MTALELEKTIILDGWHLYRTKHNSKGEFTWNIYQNEGLSLFIDFDGNMFLYDEDKEKSEFETMVLKNGDYIKFLSIVRNVLHIKKRASV